MSAPGTRSAAAKRNGPLPTISVIGLNASVLASRSGMIAHMIPATPVGEIVAQGDAEVGFQQVAELLPVPGIAFAGRLPPEVQQVTVYSAGLASGAKDPDAGRALLRYLTSAAAAPVIEKNGLQPPRS